MANIRERRAKWITACIGPIRPVRIRSHSISTAVAGCSVITRPTTPSAAISAKIPAASSCPPTTATRRKRPSPLRSMTPLPRCNGSPAVVCLLARDAGGPEIRGQVLITPVTDGADASPSMTDNADGFVLTKALMDWFWDHYADAAERADPRASPLRAEDLSGLPPALVITGEFDPLRDQGKAYAEALVEAGTPARHVNYPGQIHTSFTAVGAIPTANGAREEIAAGVRDCFRLMEPA